MAISIGQYAPLFLLGEPHSLTEKPGRPIVYRVAKSQTLPKQPCVRRRKSVFACGSSAPVRVEHEGGAAACVTGTLAAPSVQGRGLLQP